MNIAFVRHSIYNRGADRVISDYSNYLIKRSHQIFYYTSDFKSHIPHNTSIQFKHIPLPGKIGTVLFLCFKKFKEEKLMVDLVVFACLASLRNKAKVVYFAQDYDISYYSSPFLVKLIDICYWWAIKVLKVPVISVSRGLARNLQNTAIRN